MLRSILVVLFLVSPAFADSLSLDPVLCFTKSQLDSTLPTRPGFQPAYHWAAWVAFDVPAGDYSGAAFILDVTTGVVPTTFGAEHDFG